MKPLVYRDPEELFEIYKESPIQSGTGTCKICKFKMDMIEMRKQDMRFHYRIHFDRGELEPR